jgi:hypothetical protein
MATKLKKNMRGEEARRAFSRVSLPHRAKSAPRPGSLKAAVLVVLHGSKAPLSTRIIGERVLRHAWAPLGWSARRLATVLCELKNDRLIDAGPDVYRVSGESGPLKRKTWQRRAE